MVRRKQQTFLKDIKVLLSIQHKPLESKSSKRHQERSFFPVEKYGDYMKTVKGIISGHTSTSTEQEAKKMFLLKVMGMF